MNPQHIATAQDFYHNINTGCFTNSTALASTVKTLNLNTTFVAHRKTAGRVKHSQYQDCSPELVLEPEGGP